MERIKSAIEKARQSGPAQSVIRPQAAGAGNAPPPREEIGEINYSQTRVVKLSSAHLEKHRIVAFNKSNPLSVSFDMLRTQVLGKMEENGWRTLAVVSPVPECGKTVVAINLAMSIAHHSNKTAVLADFDLRRPKIGSSLGLPAGKSLNDFLGGTAALEEVLVNPGLPKLVVLPTSKPVAKSAETLSSGRVENLIQDLRNRYPERIVIFELPPLLSADDALAVLPKMDCVLMVVGNGMVSKAELEESLRHLNAVNLLGTVLNKAEIPPSNYYY